MQLAALRYDWQGIFARPKQVPPSGSWRSFGFLTGRGFGKTRALAEYVNAEVAAGRARLVCLVAQDERKSVDIQVTGPSGLVATSPPWFRARWEPSSLQVVWPNGARAYVRTPLEPGNIRGLEYHLAWASELQSWPRATMDEAFFSALTPATRLGSARVVWDATPKRRHTLLRQLLARAEADPARHRVVHGTIHENALNLGDGVLEDLDRQFGGTQRGREELLGEWLQDSEAAMVKQEWIDVTRRHAPDSYVRKVIGVDPAVSQRASSDRTGIVLAGSGVDGQTYVIADRSGRYGPEQWGAIVVDMYTHSGVDYVVCETNKAGDLVPAIIRSIAPSRGLTVVTVGADERPQRRPGTLFIKTVYARGPKEDRAQPVATAYERGRISHVIGADLAELEDTLTTWEPKPGSRSPDALDALTHAAVELLGLAENRPDPSVGFAGIQEMQDALIHGQSADGVGRQPQRAPGRSEMVTVGGHSTAYDGSASLRRYYGSGGDRI
ncbi:MAG TPA: terminase family protein [Polyangiaceae bacterium]|nr:terminase family protein [Polyangiaceae bacterium]